MSKKMPKKAASKAKKQTVKKSKSATKMVKRPAAKPAKAKMVVRAVKAVKPVARVAVAPKPLPAQKPAAVKAPVVLAAKTDKPADKSLYKVGNHVVYPTHGVGKIIAQETQMIGDIELKMLVIAFEKDKMTLRVPVHRAAAAGLRPISNNDEMKKVFVTLKSKARTSRGMWSRRAQEYEAKINSGSVISVAEVVRDLHQNVDQSERSYSERMIYESALARLVGELAAAEATDHKTANDKLMKLLRAKAAAATAEKEAA
jgi:CarD family transcriptional regulator